MLLARPSTLHASLQTCGLEHTPERFCERSRPRARCTGPVSTVLHGFTKHVSLLRKSHATASSFRTRVSRPLHRTCYRAFPAFEEISPVTNIDSGVGVYRVLANVGVHLPSRAKLLAPCLSVCLSVCLSDGDACWPCACQPLPARASPAHDPFPAVS